MSKSITNQRKVFKIHSGRFRNNNWILNLSLKEASENEEVVPLGDSNLLRIIREMRGMVVDNEINEIKKEIQDLEKNKNSKENRQKIKEKQSKLDELSFIDDYLLIIFDSNKDWDTVNSKNAKLFLNGSRYIRLVGTNGGVKKNVVVFCREELHNKINIKLNNGRDKEKKYVPGKFESYKALSCSASTPVRPPKGLLVIKDGETEVIEDVLKLFDDKNGGFELKEEKQHKIQRAFTDGCGMICKNLADNWAIDLGLLNDKGEILYTPSGFNIRNSFLKGMVFTFPYIDFAKNVAKKYIVKDAWNNDIDIRDVELIVTTNMLKLWDGYESVEDYLTKSEENGHTFSVAKVLPHKLESIRNMNYQFLQSYDFTDEDIQELIKPTIDNIKGAVGGDYTKTLLFLKGCKITDEDFLTEEFDYVKALMINKDMINDPFIKQKIYNMIKKRISDAKKGVLEVAGNYSILSGDLYALCQHMFGMKVTGLLGKGEFYSRTWSDKNVDRVVAFRAPMTVHNNIRIFNFVDNSEVRKWYRYMKTCTVLNAWDTTMDALNGCDMDGDAVITTNNPVLLKKTKELPAIICEQKVAQKKKIKENLLRNSNKNGFGNDVGGVTNKCTGMYDVISKFKKDSPEYEEMMYRIICMQGYQQEIIDSIKGIIPKEVPKHWYSYKELKIKECDSEEIKQWKLTQQQYASFKKPYFFIYNYPHVMHKYKTYIKNNETYCLTKFGLTVEELKNKNNKTQEENEFLYYYNLRMPVSLEYSTMNRICWALERELDDLKFTIKDNKFDSNIIKTGIKYSKNNYGEIQQVYRDYKREVQQYNATCSTLKKDEKREKRAEFKHRYKKKVMEVCNNKNMVCDMLIDLCYTSDESKQFVWDMCGDTIIENLLIKNNNKITYPVLSYDKNDTEWSGSHYKLIEKELKNDIVEEDI